jgi:hypothetical protein
MHIDTLRESLASLYGDTDVCFDSNPALEAGNDALNALEAERDTLREALREALPFVMSNVNDHDERDRVSLLVSRAILEEQP